MRIALASASVEGLLLLGQTVACRVPALGMAASSVPIDFIRQHCPVVVFHESEQFFPCSVEHLLKNSTLLQRSRQEDGREFHVGDPSLAELAEYNNTDQLDHFLEISPTQYSGHAPVDGAIDAPMYVAVVNVDDAFVDIYYIMLYAYQGSQTFRCTPPIAKHFNCIAHEYGRHQGDIEHFVLRTDPAFKAVLSVAYEAHGEQAWYFPGDLSAVRTAVPITVCACFAACLIQSIAYRQLDCCFYAQRLPL